MLDILEQTGGTASSNLGQVSSLFSTTTFKNPDFVSSPIEFKKTVINYMNSRASEYGYPDIFSAMSLVNSSVPELAAEGASWTEFFDSGMTYSDHKIKTNEYKNYSIFISSIEQDANSPKLSFTPSLTYPSVAV